MLQSSSPAAGVVEAIDVSAKAQFGQGVNLMVCFAVQLRCDVFEHGMENPGQHQ